MPEKGRWDMSLHPRNGKRTRPFSFSDELTLALWNVSRPSLLSVIFRAFSAFDMARIAESSLFWKKTSISEKKFVFLQCGMAVFFFVF